MGQEKIRNFCIISHVDHGKSTLADRLIEITGTVSKRDMKEQLLDSMDLERERGITIKLQPVRMEYHTDRRQDAEETQKDAELLYKDLTYKIRGAIFEVRKRLGLGHKEQIYHNALELEFAKLGLNAVSKKNISIFYENKPVGTYQPDFIIDDKVLIELKALPEIGRPQTEQLWAYLKGSKYKLALLVNFGSKDLEIKRVIYDSARNQNSAGSALSQRDSAQVEKYILNLIDTPGHVDFSYEVSRSLAACEGALLVVDASQGVQAQTLANVYLALEHDLQIIPVINKIDLPNARPDAIAAELESVFGFKREEMLFVSAKTGQGVPELLEAVVERVPAPKGDANGSLRCLIFDSTYDMHRGVVAYVRVVDGALSKNVEIKMLGSEEEVTALDVGFFKPKLVSNESLQTGEVGFIVTGLRDVRGARVGDTITLLKNAEKVKPLSGYKETQPMVYADIFPVSGDDYPELRDAVDKLKLNDAALTFEPEHVPSLGHGFRMGFLGLLHMDIVQERLSREFNVDVIATAPSVAYKLNLNNGQEKIAKSAADLPDPSVIDTMEEPWVDMNIVTPKDYLGAIMDLVVSRRGILGNVEFIGTNRINVHAEMPLASVIIDFYDNLKSATAGYASLNYTVKDYRADNLVKLDILVAGEKVEALSQIIHRAEAEGMGRQVTDKLKDLIPKQQFEIPIQAAIGGKIIARETVKAFRKDVTSGLYGGDVTRKMKHLKKQKEGKKKMKQIGKVNIPSDAFLAVLKK